MALVWAHSQAEGAALLAMLCIADHDGDGGSWPSMDTIAARARVTRDAARKIVRRLEALGEITTDRNGGGGLRTAAHMRTNRYIITIDCPPECDRSARHRERPDTDPHPVDNTPQPQGGGPAVGLGTPQPQGGANHPLTTQPMETNSVNDKYQPTREPVEEESQASDWSNWNPAARVAKAAQKVKRPDLSKDARPARVPPAPRIPPFTPTPPRAAPEPRTDAEEAAVRTAQEWPCPEGFGTGKNSRHWFPGTLTGCARCGREALTLTQPPLTDLEATE